MRPSQQRSSALVQLGRSLSHSLATAFPTPPLLLPHAAGVDISDSSIKWLALSTRGASRRVLTYGELPLESGIVVSGMIQNIDGLAAALRQVKKELGNISCAHAALPEELAYVFGMHVPYGTAREQTLRMIEFEFEDRVPIPPAAAVYDYNPLSQDGLVSDEAAVVVFPRDVAEAYVQAFESAGIMLLSLEIEARSIARAVSSGEPDEPITLLVDFGRARTGFAVLKYGLPIFTSTVSVGGESMTQALIQRLSITPEEAEVYKNEQGLQPDAGPNAPGLEIVSGTASALSDEVVRHFHYWDTRRNEHGDRMTPVGRVLLVGGSSNLKGLADYIAGRVQASTERGDVWRHVASYDDYIPPIDRRHSLQYATAIGLALRGLSLQPGI
jgi:type IV pilus assembly protein PilM